MPATSTKKKNAVSVSLALRPDTRRQGAQAASARPGDKPVLHLSDIEQTGMAASANAVSKPAPKPAGKVNETFTAKLDRQGMISRQDHLDQGRLLTSADLCGRLGFTRQALSKAVRDQRMFYVDGPSNAQLYPAFFATSTDERRKLEQVSQALGGLPGPSKWDFYITPRLSLGACTPVAALQAGDLPRVLAAAAAFLGR